MVKNKTIWITVFLLLVSGLVGTMTVYADANKAVLLREDGYKLQQKGDLDGAIATYKAAIKADPSYAIAYNDLGVVYEMQGELTEAENAYLSALKLDPNYPGTYSNLAVFYEKNGDYERALAYWEKRAQIGGANDPWVKKAEENVTRIKNMMQKITAPAIPVKPAVTQTTTMTTATTTGTYEKERAEVIEEMVAAKKAEEIQAVPAVGRKTGRELNAEKQKTKQYKKLIAQAKDDMYDGQYQTALDTLYQAQGLTNNKKELDELIDEARSQLIEYEIQRASMNSDLYKKTKLIEVDNAWYPPVPEVTESESMAELQASMKSPARLELERKASQIIPAIDFTEAQLKEVVEFLAVSNEINIVIDETVVPDNETVTIHLKEIPLNEALDIILRTKGLKYRFEENIVWITTEEKLLEEDLEVRVYDVQDLVGKLFDFPSTPFDFEKNLELGNSEK